MRKIVILFICLVIVGGGLWFWNNNADFKNLVPAFSSNGEFQILEARYTPQQLMDTHYKELVGDDNHHYLEPSYKYHPYLLLEVKYSADKKTREGVILWSLIDGEMVLNTETWERTHGFEDAISAQTSKDEFKVINAIAKGNGFRSKEDLLNDLQQDVNVVNVWIESALEKQLITSKGNHFQLHFENPKILVTPQTKFSRMLVTKPYDSSQKWQKIIPPAQIERIAKAAFGNDFSIRRMNEVYLPVYGIHVENPDSSITTTYWNAVNGQMINPQYFKTNQPN